MYILLRSYLQRTLQGFNPSVMFLVLSSFLVVNSVKSVHARSSNRTAPLSQIDGISFFSSKIAPLINLQSRNSTTHSSIMSNRIQVTCDT